MGETNGAEEKQVYINPYAEFGAEVPNWLLKRKEVTPGAKIVFGQIMQVYHEPPEDELRNTTPAEIAEDVGMEEAHVESYLHELLAHKLIVAEPNGSGLQFYPVKHAWYEEMLYYVPDKQVYRNGEVVLLEDLQEDQA